MQTPAPALELIAVSRRFRAGLAGCVGEVDALDRVSLRVERAECVGLVGGSGAGKTTLLLCAAGLLRPDAGLVRGAGAAYISSPERLREIGVDWNVMLVDSPDGLGDLASRGPLAHRLVALRTAGVAVVLAARDPGQVRRQVSRIVTLAGGRILVPNTSSRTLELDVGMPRQAALMLAERLPAVRLRDGFVQVPLRRVSAEEVLSACLELGVRVRASRVLVESYARLDRVAEGGGT